MKHYSIGLIGFGGFGQFLQAAWSEIDGVEVAAVADADPTRNPGDVRFYADWRQLIADPQLDIVAIATPPSAHSSMAKAALRAGKHVLVEKPVATTVEEAQQILEACSRADRIATVDFMLRFNPVVEALHAWGRSGCFGRLRRVVVENYAQDETLPPEHWFWDRGVSGGILVEHAVHFFDVVRWCSNARPVQVYGISLRRNPGQEDCMVATVVHEGGLVASHYHSFTRPGFFERTSMRFVFDLIQIEVDGWIPMSGRLSAIVNEENENELGRLPGFRTIRRTGVAELHDNRSAQEGGRRMVHVSGRPFQMEATVVGEFSISGTKSEAYAGALRAVMSDLVQSIDDPGHTPRVSLEDGIASLETAVAATDDAHRRAE